MLGSRTGLRVGRNPQDLVPGEPRHGNSGRKDYVANRIAFLMMVHGDPDLAVRLCHRLSPHAVFIHVDAKSVNYPIDRLTQLDGVTVIPTREAVFWSSYPTVEAIVALMQAAINTGERFSKYVVLSGACYPIKPVSSLEQLFLSDGNSEYIQLVPVSSTSSLRNLTARHWRMVPFLPWRLLARHPGLAKIDSFAQRVYNKLSSFFPRRIENEINGLQSFFGSSWWALSDACVRYMLDTLRERPSFRNAYLTVFCPEEQIFQTIVANSPFSAKSVGSHQDRGENSLLDAPLHVIYPSATRAFGNEPQDFALVRDSGKYFMRKVTSRSNAALLDRVDRELLHCE